MPKPRIRLNDLARLNRQLQRDADTPYPQLAERDRVIGAQLDATSAPDKLAAWLERVAPEQARDANHMESSIGFWLGAIGLVVGIITLAGLLFVDPSQPVNVLLFLTVFVGTQLLLLVLTLVVAFAGASGHALHLPFESLNPARLLFRRALHRLTPGLRWQQLGGVARLALLRWGQLFGVAFNLGGLTAFFIILLVTDRSFGWSSTLSLSSTALHNAMELLALPWSAWMPEATVTLDLIQATRYQALQTDFSTQQVAAMRAWWPYLAACIVTYGLLPRFLLWLIFGALYRRQLDRAFVGFPGAALVLDRLSAPWVHTRADHNEQIVETDTEQQISAQLPQRGNMIVIDWAGALKQGASDMLSRNRLQPRKTLAAGFDLSNDRQLSEKIDNDSAVVIAVKGWEPPLGELADFVRSLDKNVNCYLLLVPLPHRPLEANELSDWRHFARELSPRSLHVVRGDSVQ